MSLVLISHVVAGRVAWPVELFWSEAILSCEAEPYRTAYHGYRIQTEFTFFYKKKTVCVNSLWCSVESPGFQVPTAGVRSPGPERALLRTWRHAG